MSVAGVEGEEADDDEIGRRFLVSLRGVASRCRGIGGDSARVRVTSVAGPSWSMVSGVTSLVSQAAVPAKDPKLEEIVYAFSLPLDVTYASDTPFGWPQLVLTVYSMNSRGVEATVGYGRVHFPTTPGERSVSVPLFSPEPVSPFGSLVSWFTGKTPDLKNPDALAEGSDTYLLRTTSCGFVDLTLNIITRGLRELDYDNVPGVYR